MIKHENGVFCTCPSNMYQDILELVNHPGTQKLWAITHENGHKILKTASF
jgi:hypothetical protein